VKKKFFLDADTAVCFHNGGHKIPDNTGEAMVKFFREYPLAIRFPELI
jgi:hypothetical protein